MPVLPMFVVEFGDICNRECPLDTLRLHKQRGRWDNTNYAGSKYQPSLGGMAALPTIPGIFLVVDIQQKKCTLIDPLADPRNKELVETIEAVLSNPDNMAVMPFGGEKVKAWPKVEHNLDDDTLKTLLLEVARKFYVAKEIRTFNLIDGRVPTVDVIEQLPGRELFDPWSNNPDRPKYVDQVAAWKDRITSANAQGIAS